MIVCFREVSCKHLVGTPQHLLWVQLGTSRRWDIKIDRMYACQCVRVAWLPYRQHARARLARCMLPS